MRSMNAIALSAVVTLAGASAATAFTPSHRCAGSCDHGAAKTATEVSMTAEHADVAPLTISVALAGYSPVSYIENNRAEPGSPRYTAEHGGATYFFTSDAQRRMFVAKPKKYLPAYGGYCAFGCSVESNFVPDPTSFKVIDGKTHLFLKNDEVDAKALWNEANPREVRTKANAYWSAQRAAR